MTTTEKDILSILKTIEGSGSFETSGIKNFVPPGLIIAGIGEVSFPLNPILTKAIIASATQAPFGKGSKTVTDTKVRSAWEIDADQISFNNEDWSIFLREIINEVKAGLGIENQEIQADLYKLLIYQEGDFFLPHKDSEKEKGMFATLVISLPSNHTGGELIVRFEGKEEIIDFSPSASNYKIPYAAFYADCEHEIKPVTSGYRVNLVYNLLQTEDGNISSPQFSEQVADMVGLIKSMETSFGNEPKAILLEHQYTPANFSLGQLKHHDWPRAQALLEAADKAGYFARLGLLTHYIMGDLEGGYDDYYGRRSRYNRVEEETEGTMGEEIYELYSQIKHWSKDSGPTLGEMTLDESDILTSIELGAGKPIEQEQEGYTGNAGMTIEYWYHYGAVILWPKSKHTDLLFQQPIAKRLDWLDYYVQNWDNVELNSKAYGEKLLLGLSAEEINEKYYNKEDYSPVAAALVTLGDTAFLRKEGNELLTKIFEQIKVTHWIQLLENFTPAIFNPVFQTVGTKDNIAVSKHLLGILDASIVSKSVKVAAFSLHHIHQLPTYLAAVTLQEIQEKYSYNDTRKENIIAIIKKTLAVSKYQETDNQWINKIVAALTQTLPRDYANEVLIPVLLEEVYQNSLLAYTLRKVIHEDLTKRTRVKPTPPENWSREVPKSEYYQDRIEILRSFLKSPSQQVFDYSKNEKERKQMTSAIRSVTIDLRTETIKRGSPYTLRLTKTQAAYDKKLEEWKEDRVFLEKINNLKNRGDHSIEG